MSRKKTTILTLQKRKDDHVPITMVTAYDFSSATLVDRAGMDIILVGDTLGMGMLGRDSTVSVTMDEMVHHCRAVAHGAQSAFLVGDMPFMSYQPSIPEAIRNAGRFLKEAGMDAIKLEGGQDVADKIRAIVNAGVPVMGHTGLTPQTVSQLGGFKVQGKTAVSAQTLLENALALEKAGCFAIVLEAVPASVATAISQRLTIPTIGIGAGAGCNGQVLVYHDMLGLFVKFVPKLLKQYAHVGDVILDALETYRDEVQNGTFPAEEHTYPMNQTEEETFLKSLNGAA